VLHRFRRRGQLRGYIRLLRMRRATLTAFCARGSDPQRRLPGLV
jgi:hypothetical protein